MRRDSLVPVRITDGVVLLREQVSPTVSRSLITFTFYPITSITDSNNLYESPLIVVPSLYRPIRVGVTSFGSGSDTFAVNEGFWAVVGVGPEEANTSSQIHWCAITPRNYGRSNYLFRARAAYGDRSTPTGNPPSPALMYTVGVHPFQYSIPYLNPKPDDAWFFRILRRGVLTNTNHIVHVHFIVEERNAN